MLLSFTWAPGKYNFLYLCPTFQGCVGSPRLYSKIPPAQKLKAMCIYYVTVFCSLEIQAQLH